MVVLQAVSWWIRRTLDSLSKSVFRLLLKAIVMLLVLAKSVRDSDGQIHRLTTSMPGVLCKFGLSRAAEEHDEKPRVLTNEVESFWWS